VDSRDDETAAPAKRISALANVVATMDARVQRIESLPPSPILPPSPVYRRSSPSRTPRRRLLGQDRLRT